MENVITNDDRTAMAEVDYIIHHMNERYLNKIPQNVQDFIAILKKKTAKVYVDPHQPLEKQGLKEFTLYFLMILNLKYWCDDARRRDILLMLENNQKKYDDKVNHIFHNAESIEVHDTVEASRPLNKPKKVVVAETTTSSEKAENVEEMQQSVKVVKTETTNALNDLEKEANAITTTKEENFFTKFISKIKSLLIKKK